MRPVFVIGIQKLIIHNKDYFADNYAETPETYFPFAICSNGFSCAKIADWFVDRHIEQ